MRPKRDSVSFMLATMAPSVDLFLWPLIFQFLEAEDLVSVSAVCFSWWQFVFRGRVSSPIQRALVRCDEITLANTGSLYLKVPLRCFSRLKRINLRGTTISTKHFLQMVKITRRLRVLDIESCGNISESAIFKAKESLRYMTNVNISNNSHLSILSMACLCSFPSIQEIRAKGLMLEAKESLFLVKTFPRLASGQIALETETSDSEDYFFDVVDLVADEEELFGDFFQ